MSFTSPPDARQIISRDTLNQLTGVSGSYLDDILRAINSEVTMPFRMSCTGANRVLTIGAITLANPDTSITRSPLPINSLIPTFSSGTLTLSATGSGTITISTGGTPSLFMTASQYLKVGVSVDTSAAIHVNLGTAASSLAAATQPDAPAGYFQIGYFVVRTDGSNNVQNILSTDIYKYDGYGQTSFLDSAFKVVNATDITKQLKVDVSGGVTGTNTTISTIQTTNKTITLPDATDTLVGKATTDTLTNKTLTSPAINTPNLDGGAASATSRVVVSKDTTTNLTSLTRKQGAIYYDTTANSLTVDNGTSLTPIAGSGTASPSSQGTVTSYVPTIRSAVNTVSSANYTMLATDGYSTILVTTGSSNRTITLPAGNLSAGRIITIRKQDTGSGTVIISSAGSETLDGYTLSGNGYFLSIQYAQVTLICDGTNWQVLSTAGDRITSGAISDTVVGSTTFVAVTGASITLPPGAWQVYANGHLNLSQNGVGGVQLFAGGSFAGGSATVFNNVGVDNPTNPFSFRVPVRITTATTYTLQIFSAGNTTTFVTSAGSVSNDHAAQFYAERVN